MPRGAPRGHVAVCSSGGGRDKAAVFPVGTEPGGPGAWVMAGPLLKLPSHSLSPWGLGPLHNEALATGRWREEATPLPPPVIQLPIRFQEPPPRRWPRGSQGIGLPLVGPRHAVTT